MQGEVFRVKIRLVVRVSLSFRMKFKATVRVESGK